MPGITTKHKILSIIVLGVLAGLLCFVFLYSYDKEEKSGLVQKTEIELQKQAGEIIIAKDFMRCDEIADSTYKEVCVNNIALNLAKETGVLTYCEKINNKLLSREDCERQVIFEESLKKEDVGVCGETKNTTLKEGCENAFWRSFALMKNNVGLCENISTEQMRNYCYDSYTLNNDSIAISTLNCSLFRDKQAQEDCKKYKETSDKGRGCEEMSASLFFDHCLINN